MWRSICCFLLAGCASVEGGWDGTCEYLGGQGNLREAKIHLELEAMDDEGVGVGTARVDEGGDKVKADVLYLVLDDALSVDLYLENRQQLYLRGALVENDLAKGTCGKPEVERFSVNALVDCVLELNLRCDTSKDWNAKANDLAPVKKKDLDGDFKIRRE